jgi:hypothetical protein
MAICVPKGMAPTACKSRRTPPRRFARLSARPIDWIQKRRPEPVQRQPAVVLRLPDATHDCFHPSSRLVCVALPSPPNWRLDTAGRAETDEICSRMSASAPARSPAVRNQAPNMKLTKTSRTYRQRWASILAPFKQRLCLPSLPRLPRGASRGTSVVVHCIGGCSATPPSSCQTTPLPR